jgi:hypothetical protein
MPDKNNFINNYLGMFGLEVWLIFFCGIHIKNMYFLLLWDVICILKI